MPARALRIKRVTKGPENPNHVIHRRRECKGLKITDDEKNASAVKGMVQSSAAAATKRRENINPPFPNRRPPELTGLFFNSPRSMAASTL